MDRRSPCEEHKQREERCAASKTGWPIQILSIYFGISHFFSPRALFSIDLTSIGGNVLETQIVKKAIANAPEKIVATPSANYLLFQKCETFLNRRHVKARDAFDIQLLLTRGAHLDKNLQAHLEDFIATKEIDQESIETRIQDINAKLCTVELRPVLPLAIFEELAQNEFEAIRHSLRVVLAHWLGKETQ